MFLLRRLSHFQFVDLSAAVHSDRVLVVGRVVCQSWIWVAEPGTAAFRKWVSLLKEFGYRRRLVRREVRGRERGSTRGRSKEKKGTAKAGEKVGGDKSVGHLGTRWGECASRAVRKG